MGSTATARHLAPLPTAQPSNERIRADWIRQLTCTASMHFQSSKRSMMPSSSGQPETICEISESCLAIDCLPTPQLSQQQWPQDQEHRCRDNSRQVSAKKDC